MLPALGVEYYCWQGRRSHGTFRVPIELGDPSGQQWLGGGRVVTRDMAVTMARWDGEALPTLVVFGDPGSLPILGAYTLEGFGLAPDPVNRRLIPVRGLALQTGLGTPYPR